MREYINICRLDESSSEFEHELVLQLRGDFVNHFVEFLKTVKDIASGGHSFSIEADRTDHKEGECPELFIDGDGADQIVNILLDGKKVG